MFRGGDPRLHARLARVGGRKFSRRTALKGAVAGGLATGAAGGLFVPGSAPNVLVRSAYAQDPSTLAIGLPEEPNTMDPQFADGVLEYTVLVNIMEGLFTTGDNTEVVPVLVESWEQLDDLTWEFRLHEGVTFHNGEPLTAEAVKASYERSVDPEVNARRPWAGDVNIEEIEIVDDFTVRFHTSAPTPHMLARLANDHFIYPPQYLAESDATTVARTPIGTGPYVFQGWAQGENITMTANPDYWGEPKPSIETVIWRFIPEDTSRLASLQTGQIDLMRSLLPTAIEEVESQENLAVVGIEGTRRVYIGLNTKLEPTTDKLVRQALNYGTDVETIAEVILGGATTRMQNWAEVAFRNPDVTGYSYDPGRARELLAEAGYSDGINVTWDLATTGTVGIAEFPQAVVISLREVGVEVELNVLEPNILSQNTEDRTVNQLYSRTNAAYFDPGLTFDVWRLDNIGNGAQWENEEFESLRQQIYTGGTPEERLEWSYRMQEIIMEEAPAIFLWYQPDIYGINTRVQGFTPNGDERIRVAGMTLSG
jgi:peptide/nickel transport system substrate-binding protein